MQNDVSKVVYPVFLEGLGLRERLRRGQQGSIEGEQARLKGILGLISGGQAVGPDAFMGIRYPLTCWLDEIILSDTAWKDKWSERTLELALFNKRDRAWLFWEQAEKAKAWPGSESMSASDALEVFFLCVVLGFRGQMRENPPALQEWLKATQTQIGKMQGLTPPHVAERGSPTTNVPPLHGQRQFHSVLLVAAVALLVFIPLLVFLLVRHMVVS